MNSIGRAIAALLATAVILSGCAGLALTPSPVEQSRTSLLPAGRLPPSGNTGAQPEITSTPAQSPLSEPSITATLELTETPTLTPTLEMTVTPAPVITTTLTATPTATPTTTISTTAELTPTLEPLAPVVLLDTVDLGFRPNPDGYVFANYGGVTRSDYTIADMRRMFGDAAVCVSTRGVCVAQRAAVQWNDLVHSLMTGGHCDGFTVTGLRFFMNIDARTALQSRVTQTYQLRQTLARRNIAYFWTLQVPDPVGLARYENVQKSPLEVLQQIYAAFTARPPEPTTLLVYNSQRTSGHSITPYAIERAGADVWRLRVYDSNWPNDPNRAVVITTTTNTWSYDLGRGIGVWSGDANSHSLGAVPIALYAQRPDCPWCQNVRASAGVAHALVTSEGGSQLVISNSQDRQIGLTSAGALTDLPGAYSTLLPGGLGYLDASAYYLPVTDTYTLTIGSSLSADGGAQPASPAVTVREFGPNYAVAASNLSLTGDDTSQLAVRAAGQQLVYRSGTDDRLTLDLVAETPGLSQEVELGHILIGDGRAVTITLDAARQRVILDNTDNVTTTYDLTYTRVVTSIEQTFTTSGAIAGGADTQIFDFSAWAGSGPITVTIQTGGALTQTVPLLPMPYRWRAPFISG
jgi:hypothetical protein